jgi:hypothetical protein
MTAGRRGGWETWWAGLLSSPAVEFFRKERDFILKEGPPKINQVCRPPSITSGSTEAHTGSALAANSYYYEAPDIPAIDTIKRHLDEIERLIVDYPEVGDEPLRRVKEPPTSSDL